MAHNVAALALWRKFSELKAWPYLLLPHGQAHWESRHGANAMLPAVRKLALIDIKADRVQ